MNTDELQLQKRWIELSELATRKGIVTFSNFLTLSELNSFHQITGRLSTAFQLSGGYEFAERQMAAFIPDALYYDWNYPFSCIRFQSSYPKFSEELTHRDFLGALMNLGIERNKFGDIVKNDSSFYLFCSDSIQEYILQELVCVKHTSVNGTVIDLKEFDFQPETAEVIYNVASPRLDTIVSAITHLSRSRTVELIQAQKVFINGQICTENARVCKVNEKLSIRGYGKFQYQGILQETKKGRNRISILHFI